MTLLGTLLKNRRGRDLHSAWERPNLQGPELLVVTSPAFLDGEAMPRDCAGTRVGGMNVSPSLTWSRPPLETTQLLLVVEDLDVPTAKPAVHCLVVLDPRGLDSPGELPPGSLSRRAPAAGVRILRSTISRGYHGPEPIKGHGPHRYTFQLFAFSRDAVTNSHSLKLDRVRPRELLTSLDAPVIARGRLTGVYER